jgi:hypothetical protein
MAYAATSNITIAQARDGGGQVSAAGLESSAGWLLSIKLPLHFEPGGAIHVKRSCDW